MATFRVPLTTTPQRFAMQVSGVEYIFTVRWTEFSGWIMDIANSATGEPIVTNIAFVTGADLMEQFKALGFDWQAIIYTDGDPLAVPTIDNIGTQSNLYLVTP